MECSDQPPFAQKVIKLPAIYLKVAKPQLEILTQVHRLMQKMNHILCSP